MQENVQQRLDLNNCTGCGLCSLICPTNAIMLRENIQKALVRWIDQSRCIGCGKCVAFCPQITSKKMNYPIHCYASYPTREIDCSNFSSGGVATLIAEAFIEKKHGVVCGCAWNPVHRRAEHRLAMTVEEVKSFQGSKYVQSDIAVVLPQIKKCISEHIPVLFIGTPCQVDTVKKYCGLQGLYTADLICHGTPPASYLKEYIESLPRYKEIKQVRFRGKRDFWFSAEDNNNKLIYCAYKDDDPYFHAFLEGVFYRENCYSCQYAQINRTGDLTLGDFWGLDRSNINYEGNISLILCNTKAGKNLLSIAQNKMNLLDRTIEEAIRGNLQLSAPMPITEAHMEFQRLLEAKRDFMTAFRMTSTYQEALQSSKKRTINMKKAKIKKIIKRFFPL